MKFATASTLALALATTGAFAANHTTGNTATDSGMTEETSNMETGATGLSAESDTAETSVRTRSDWTEMESDYTEMPPELIRTRDITGGTIYTSNEANDEGWNSETIYDAVGDGWNEIGTIEDVVLSKTGQMVGIVGEVGGFLDIGDKHVMIKVEDIRLVPVDDRSYAYVTRLSEEELEQMKGVDEGYWN